MLQECGFRMRGSLFPCWFFAATPIVLAAAPQLAVPVPTASNVVGLWLFDESEGPHDPSEQNWGIYDQSGLGQHGFRGPLDESLQIVSGKVPVYTRDVPKSASWNLALDFGVDNAACVRIPHCGRLSPSRDFTVETWVQFHSLRTDQVLISKRDGPGGYWLQWDQSEHAIRFGVVTEQGGVQNLPSRRFAPEVGKWYHVAAVHDGRNRELLLYLDGRLNGRRSVGATVISNDKPLVFGQHPDGSCPLDAMLDEVRLSNRAVPVEDLGATRSFGPARIAWGDAFSAYSSSRNMFTYGAGERNRWRLIQAPRTAAALTKGSSANPNPAILLSHRAVPPSDGGNEISLYYNLPLETSRSGEFATRGEPLVGIRGWASFSGLDGNARLVLLDQIWTGDAKVYGVTDTNLAASVEYWGNTKTWKISTDSGRSDLSRPVDYGDDATKWHYFHLVANFETKRFVAFQFDTDFWDLSQYSIYTRQGMFTGVLPVVDFNVRLMSVSPAPAESYSADFAVDNVTITLGPEFLPANVR